MDGASLQNSGHVHSAGGYAWREPATDDWRYGLALFAIILAVVILVSIFA